MTEEENNHIRDYSLTGKESETVISKGLVDASWYTSPIPRDKMKELLVRKNGPGIRDTVLWFGLMIVFAVLTIILWGSWWAVVPYLAYAVLFASTSDSRWHESSHGTAFKSDWMNNVLYEVSSFMVFRQSTVWRYSHTRHHSDTLVRGRDPEISVPRPPDIPGMILNFFALKSAPAEFRKLLIHASGRIDQEVATYLPESEYSKVIRTARIYLSIFASVIAASIIFSTPFPVLFIGLPTFVGSWLMPFYGLTQHAGLAENVLDHRLNCRTVYMNRVHRFLYWNMNYHIEHHMFPLVPYHALPKLHELMKDDCPPPYHGIINTFKEIVPAVRRQVKDPGYFVTRVVPENKLQNKINESINLKGKTVTEEGWIELGEKKLIENKDILRVDFRDETFAIYQLEDGKLYATEGFCTHGNAHLADGLIVNDQIECSKHNGRFEIKDGTVARPPVCVGLKTHEVKVDEGMILLNINPSNSVNEENSRKYKVVSNDNVATYIKELVLEPLEGELITYRPGDYMHLEIPSHQTSFRQMKIEEPYRSVWEEQGIFEQYSSNHSKTKRNYSLASNPVLNKQLKFNIRLATAPRGKNVKAGLGSSYVFNLNEGDTVYLSGPYGDFHIKDDQKEMVYVGGGAGMAPLRSHISQLLEVEKSSRKISFWYGARSLQEVFYSDYFEKLAKENDNFTFNLALSEATEKDEWDSHTGFIHEVLEKEYLNGLKNLNDLDFYLCGPPAMISACREMLKAKGVDRNAISFDEF